MKLLKELKFSFYIMLHPFKGFWDLKHEHEGSLRSSMVLVALAVLTQIASAYFTEYLLNGVRIETYNLLTTIAVGYGLFFGWCISNWCFTCLSEGEGTLRDIMTAIGYALTPFILVSALQLPISYFIVQREIALYNLLSSVGLVWTGMLVFFGTLVVHQYSFRKTIIVCLATIVGMAIMVYVGILFLNLIQVMVSFFTELFDEIRITMY